MTNLDAIKFWLKNPNDYNRGLLLYNNIKVSTKHDKFLNSGAGRAQLSILKQSLFIAFQKLQANPSLVKKINDASASSVAKVRKTPKLTISNQQSTLSAVEGPATNSTQTRYLVSNQKSKPLIFDTPEHIDIKDLPINLQEKYRQTKVLFRKQRELLLSLQDAKSDPERAEIRQSLIEVEDKRIAHFNEIDDYLSNPDLSNNDSELQRGIQLHKKIKNTKEYIRRDTLKLSQAKKHPAIEKLKKRIAKREKELKSYEAELQNG